MLDVQDINSQAGFDTETMTPADAAEQARVERWTPHVEDGIDAFARVIHEVEAEKWAQVITAAGSDPAYRARLAADPTATIGDFGITLPAGVTLRVVEDSPSVRHLVLPPTARALSADEAELLADRLADLTGTTLLPQCWADTWKASEPLDPGMPLPDRPIKPIGK